MDQELKVKWVVALRSGQYTQGAGYLKKNWEVEPKHCCLGVLCEVMDADQRPNEDTGVTAFADDPDVEKQDTHYLPEGVRERAGIAKSDQRQLTDLNDVNCLTFNEIADWIEERL